MTNFETIKATFGNGNGNTFEYAKVNDTCYTLTRQLKDSKDVETYNRPELWKVLENCRNNRNRVHIWYRNKCIALYSIHGGKRYAK